MYSCIIIGSGFSGICMGIKLKQAGIDNFLILEKANSLGGTWRENTYPGAECDIPSALYSYSFEPYPDWKYKWSEQNQILQYLNHCADKYQVKEHIRFQACVSEASFNESTGFWNIELSSKEIIQSKTFVSAIGQLHHPSIPSFEGLKNLSIQHFHSANWDHSIDLKNKRIGVIGNGASAVQFIPEIAKEAKAIFVYQRSPNWIISKQDRAYRSWEKSLVNKFPILLKLYRLKIWLSAGLLFNVSILSTLFNFIIKWKSAFLLRRSIKDKELRKRLTPNFQPGAKRTLFSSHYFKTIGQAHVHLLTDPIQRILSSGIETENNSLTELDVLIFATGFHSNPFLKHIKIQGLNKQGIREKWQDGETSYFGITSSGFPNFFMLYGPNTNLGHNSIILMIEAQSKYITQAIQAIQKKDCKYMNLKASIEAKHDLEIQQRLSKSIWASIPNSWYKSGNRIPNNWPGRTMEYVRRTKKLKDSDYDFVS